jgi:hypothetical protein
VTTPPPPRHGGATLPQRLARAWQPARSASLLAQPLQPFLTDRAILTAMASQPHAAHGRAARPAPSQSTAALHPTPAPQPFPAVDDGLVARETRFEIIDGKLHETVPADPPHATANCQLAYVLQASVRVGFRAAVDMLTRVNRTSEFAPDASVFPAEADPETGGRRLELMAFEVLDSQRPAGARRKARLLTARGVERVFAIDLVEQRVLAWERGRWRPLPEDGQIDEPRCMIRALPVRALLDATAADNAAASALLAKGNIVLEQHTQAAQRSARADGVREGKAEGLRAAIETACELLDIELSALRREQLQELDGQAIEALLATLRRERRWPG